MQYILSNSHLDLKLNTQSNTWSLYSKLVPGALIEDASIRARYRRKRTRFLTLHKWSKAKIEVEQNAQSHFGNGNRLHLSLPLDSNGIKAEIEFFLPENTPCLLWQIKLFNQGKKSIRLDNLTLLQAGVIPRKYILPTKNYTLTRHNIPQGGGGVVRPHESIGNLAFFSNGWQSWSYTGTYFSTDVYRRTRLGPFGAPMWYNASTPLPKSTGHFVSDMFGVLGDRTNRCGILLGFASQNQQFGHLEARTSGLYPFLRLQASGDTITIPPGQHIETDWAYAEFIELDSPDPLGHYMTLVAKLNQVDITRRQANMPTLGWCSWYHYFEDISHETIQRNTQAAHAIQSRLPIDLIQIDDGFESRVGDWLTHKETFPEGVASLAQIIKDHGMTPGLWLAPFIVHPTSRVAKEHRDWLLRGFLGQKVNAGFVWNAFNHALDLTHPDASNYVQEVIHTAVDKWGFPYLKLDFLYAAALPGYYRDPTKTRAQVLRYGLELIREAAGDETFLLGCGCPLGPAIGLLDAMRVGADVAPNWEPEFMGLRKFFHPEPSMPAARNALQNPLTRTAMHKRWWFNDPDCLLLRPQTTLTTDEVRTIASVISLTDGLLLLSDDLSQLPPERLSIAQVLLPHLDQRPRVMDWFDVHTPRHLRHDLSGEVGEWHILALFNWEDTLQEVPIALDEFALTGDGDWYARSFWDGEIYRLETDHPPSVAIPPHGVKVLAVRQYHGEDALYLGSNLHISQGLEVTTFKIHGKTLHIDIERPMDMTGEIDLLLKSPPSPSNATQAKAPLQHIRENLYRIQVETSGGKANLRIPLP